MSKDKRDPQYYNCSMVNIQNTLEGGHAVNTGLNTDASYENVLGHETNIGTTCRHNTLEVMTEKDEMICQYTALSDAARSSGAAAVYTSLN
jgi:fumarate hydratase class II